MVAVINVDAYPYVVSSDLVTLRIQEWVFSSCTVPPNKKVEQLGSSNQEASPSAGKITGIVLVTCRACKYPYRYFRRREFFGGPWLSLLRQTSSQ